MGLRPFRRPSPVSAIMRRVLLVVLACLVAGAATFHAASATFWQVSTQADFLKGEGEAIAIDADGRLSLGRTLGIVADPATPVLWRAIVHDGALVAGSGHDGKVFRVGRDGTSTLLVDTEQVQVHAIAPGPGRDVYVGTSPDGRVLRVDPSGRATTVFDPEEKYVWALARSAAGALLVATGEPGGVHVVNADGTSRLLYRAKATHVTTLLPQADGSVIVGTDSPGQVIRLSADGKPFVLLDSPQREIRALTADRDGHVLVAAMTARGASEPRAVLPTPAGEPAAPSATPVPSVTTEVVITAIGDSVTSTPATGRADARRDTKGSVYRIAPDGLWDELWSSDDDVPYDLVRDGDDVLVVTGNKGKVFRLSPDTGRATLVAQAPAQQLTGLLRGPDNEWWAISANPGKVFRLGTRVAERGEYVSDVLDATTTTSWGVLRWSAVTPPGTAVTVQTRSGNTSRPDDTWSEWSAALTRADGDPVTSPKARYLQWRAQLVSKDGVSPVVNSVTVAYLPRNVRPRVTSITVHPPGTVFLRPYSSGEFEIAGFDAGTSDGRNLTSIAAAAPTQSAAQPALGRRAVQKGLQTFVWKAEDANDDRLQYDVLYRREDETAWHPLRRGLWDPLLTWDTTFVPDGAYVIKVVASDLPGNDVALALRGEAESATFVVDNTAPEISFDAPVRAGARTRLSFTVKDATSPVLRVEYSLDAQRWQAVFPVDGINDGRVERFDVTAEPNGAREVTVRAFDALNNVVTASARLTPDGR